MSEKSWSLEVAGLRLSLEGPVAWIDPLARSWARWEGGTGEWKVSLLLDGQLPPPAGPYFGARPRFEGKRSILECPGYAGSIDTRGHVASLRAHPSATLGDLSYFVRTVFALAAFEEGNVLFHGAGIVHGGRAYALFGNSGSGKTTAARLSTGKTVLNDDLLLLKRNGCGGEVWATPFGRRRHPDVRFAPLAALLRLVQAPQDQLASLPRATALAALIANTPVVNADPRRLPLLLDWWQLLLKGCPVHDLHFRKANTFWEVIDAQLG